MSLKIENSRRVAKSRPVCMDLKAGFPLGGILRAERNFSLSFLISSTREITRQRKILVRAQNPPSGKPALKSTTKIIYHKYINDIIAPYNTYSTPKLYYRSLKPVFQ
jgi:hypothetical protein